MNKIKIGKKSLIKFSLIFLFVSLTLFIILHFISIKAESGISVITSDPIIKGDLWSKKVIVSSDPSNHVYNISVSTDIPEDLINIELYRFISSDMKMRVTDNLDYNFQLIDTDDNGKRDTATWIIPELSEISFSVEGQFSEPNEEGTVTAFGDDFIQPLSPGPDDITGVSCTGTGGSINCVGGGCYDDPDCLAKTSGTCSGNPYCPDLAHAHNISDSCGTSYTASECQKCQLPNGGEGTCKSAILCSVTGTCNYDCDAGWYNCDGIKSNGCESGCTCAEGPCLHPYTHKEVENEGTLENPANAYDNDLNDTSTYARLYTSRGSGELGNEYESVKYIWDFSGQPVNGTLFYTYSVDVTWTVEQGMAYAYVKAWNYNTEQWDTKNMTVKDLSLDTYHLNLGSDYFNSTGHAEVLFQSVSSRLSGNPSSSEIFLYDTYIQNITGAPPPDNPPQYSLNSTNSTVAGTPIEHRLYWTDETGLSFAIFSFDNCTGTLENVTNTSLSGNTDWSNFTVTINSTVGCTIRWCVYANDTNDNWNGTSCGDPFTFNTANFVEITLSQALLDGIMFDTVTTNTVGNPARNNSHPETRYNVTVGSSSTQNLDFYVKLNETFETGIYVNESSSKTSNTAGFTTNTTVYDSWSILGNTTSNCTNIAIGNNCWTRLYFDVGNVPSGYKQRDYTICGVINGNNPSICG